MMDGSFVTRDDDLALVIAARIEAERPTPKPRRVCPEHGLELAPWEGVPGVVFCPWCGYEERTR
jgi:hypothetical protein